LRAGSSTNTTPHKAPGYGADDLAEAVGEAPGDATSEQMRLVADLAEESRMTKSA
jgi:sulfite reductase (NADPH) hemoprotein beta-component